MTVQHTSSKLLGAPATVISKGERTAPKQGFSREHGYAKGEVHHGPSLHPTKCFIELSNQHDVLGRLVRCRTGRPYAGEFRGQFFPGKAASVEKYCRPASTSSGHAPARRISARHHKRTTKNCRSRNCWVHQGA
ncbi:hypothetical protein K443DRAFT_349306 [Laccaria amethystina LaAM-08-1]|uniref:Uncharacterized protein n=1 Tax=Laccaria amethystina LaAM-08-1 TaxID=1095629 RepID=A0A0C9WJI5_9AGAR|nr:hypothetical protein K443DRAFT_349306 [Laccaria amethystina LaAM-08-1]